MYGVRDRTRVQHQRARQTLGFAFVLHASRFSNSWSINITSVLQWLSTKTHAGTLSVGLRKTECQQQPLHRYNSPNLIHFHLRFQRPVLQHSCHVPRRFYHAYSSMYIHTRLVIFRTFFSKQRTKAPYALPPRTHPRHHNFSIRATTSNLHRDRAAGRSNLQSSHTTTCGGSNSAQ